MRSTSSRPRTTAIPSLKLNNGIPPEAGTVHVIREDPVNPNLLFAGTEFGIFVTFDKRRQLASHEERLADRAGVRYPDPSARARSDSGDARPFDLDHGQHFGAGEVGRPGALSDVKLVGGGRPGIEWKMANYRGFEGQSNFFAANAPNGVILDYWLKAGGPVQVKVTDKDGKQVRQINVPRGEAGVLNRTVWDMRADPPVLPPAGAEAAAVDAAAVEVAGRGGGAALRRKLLRRRKPAAAKARKRRRTERRAQHRVRRGSRSGRRPRRWWRRWWRPRRVRRRRAGRPRRVHRHRHSAGKSDSATVTVEEDPRVELSPEDRAKRRKAIDTLDLALIRAADEPTRKAVGLTTALTSLTASWTGPNAVPVPDAAKKAVEDMEAKVKAAAATFQAPAGGGGAEAAVAARRARGFRPAAGDAETYAPDGMIGNFSGPPTSRQLADIEEANRPNSQKGNWRRSISCWDEVPKLNKVLTDAGVAYFKVTLPATRRPPGPRARRELGLPLAEHPQSK
jgi:hypothetical protein